MVPILRKEGEVEMTIKETPNKITAVLKVTATAEFFDDEASEETVRYVIEQDLEDAGFDVDVALLKEQEPVKPETVVRTGIREDPTIQALICGNCHKIMGYVVCYNYCPWCGRKGKWDE